MESGGNDSFIYIYGINGRYISKIIKMPEDIQFYEFQYKLKNNFSNNYFNTSTSFIQSNLDYVINVDSNLNYNKKYLFDFDCCNLPKGIYFNSHVELESLLKEGYITISHYFEMPDFIYGTYRINDAPNVRRFFYIKKEKKLIDFKFPVNDINGFFIENGIVGSTEENELIVFIPNNNIKSYNFEGTASKKILSDKMRDIESEFSGIIFLFQFK